MHVVKYVLPWVCQRWRAIVHRSLWSSSWRSSRTQGPTLPTIKFFWEASCTGGHLTLMQWALARGCPSALLTCAMAARVGSLETLQWVHARSRALDSEACALAAERGHLAMLQWLRERKAALGITGRVQRLPEEATWRCCSGLAHRAVRGMRALVHRLLRKATWMSCGGPARKAVLGINGLACGLIRETPGGVAMAERARLSLSL